MATSKIMAEVSTVKRPFFQARWALVLAVNAILLPLKCKPWTPVEWLFRFDVEIVK